MFVCDSFFKINNVRAYIIEYKLPKIQQGIDLIPVVSNVEIIKYWSTTDDLPSTTSGTIGVAQDLLPSQKYIVGFYVKSASGITGQISDLTDFYVNFGLDTEPLTSAQFTAG